MDPSLNEAIASPIKSANESPGEVAASFLSARRLLLILLLVALLVVGFFVAARYSPSAMRRRAENKARDAIGAAVE